MKIGFDQKPIHVGFLADKVALGQVCSENYEFPSKCCLNIHETKIDAVKFKKCLYNICRNFSKPNQLQISKNEYFTKLQQC